MKQRKKLGFITIGQSPRKDMMDDVKKILSEKFEIIEVGALDDYSTDHIINNFKPLEDKNVLVTKLRNGMQVNIDQTYLEPLVQNTINKLEKDAVSIIVLFCTGDFSNLKSNSILIESSIIVQNVVKSIARNKKIGVLIPDEKQTNQMRNRWCNGNLSAEIEAVSPYVGIDEMKKVISRLNKKNIDMIILDCMGYTCEMKNIICEMTNKEVILSRTLVARIINELY